MVLIWVESYISTTYKFRTCVAVDLKSAKLLRKDDKFTFLKQAMKKQT